MDTASQYRLYGLLHVSERQGKHINLRAKRADPIDVYLRCAQLCSMSMQRFGVDFALITNRVEALTQRAEVLGLHAIKLRQHRFSIEIPAGLPFYSAHHKLDVVRALGSGDFGEWVGLVDIDTVLCDHLALEDIGQQDLWAYDISDQVMPQYGGDVVARDIDSVAGEKLKSHRWYGGEFLVGGRRGFEKLSAIIDLFLPRYFQLCTTGKLHHIGDEMIVSSALNAMKIPGIKILDAGKKKLVTRWWTARTNVEQLRFSAVSDCSLLHLPADKEFLSGVATEPFEPADFKLEFRKYASNRLRLRRMYSAVQSLVSSERKYVGRL